MNVKKPIQHSMARRSAAHDYSRPGIYHVTLHVAEGMGQPLGAVDAYVVMPEHLHFILMVSGNIVSRNGRATHLGQVIAGFKKGCNRAFWAITGQTLSGAVPNQTPPPPGKPAATVCGGLPAAPPAALAPAPAASCPPSSASAIAGGLPSARQLPFRAAKGAMPRRGCAWCRACLCPYREGRAGHHRRGRASRFSRGAHRRQRFPRRLSSFYRAYSPLRRGTAASAYPLAVSVPGQERAGVCPLLQDDELCGTGSVPPQG